jgi:hypothetical protein
MRILAFVIAISLVFGTAVRADEPDSSGSLAEAQPFRDRWQACTAAAVKRRLEGKRPAEAVADLALDACKAQEAALANVLKRRLGPSAARRVVDDLRTYDRVVLTRIIERLRGK